MGRNRVPTAKLEVTGAFVRNPKRKAARRNEPAADDPVGDPPEHLDAAQRAAWVEVAALAGWLRAPDRVALEVAVRLLVTLRADGELSGAHTTALTGLLGKFGMTPSDRSRVSAPPPEEPEDPAEQFFR
jgi:hypothetical protein